MNRWRECADGDPLASDRQAKECDERLLTPHITMLNEEVMSMGRIQFLLDMILRFAELVIQFLSYLESKKGRR